MIQKFICEKKDGGGGGLKSYREIAIFDNNGVTKGEQKNAIKTFITHW